MIRSGLVSQKLGGGFEEGYAHERNNHPRNVLMRPYVNPDDPTILHKSDFSDPLAEKVIIPNPVMYDDIFAKKTSPDERLYILRQIQKGLKQIATGLNGIKPRMPDGTVPGVEPSPPPAPGQPGQPGNTIGQPPNGPLPNSRYDAVQEAANVPLPEGGSTLYGEDLYDEELQAVNVVEMPQQNISFEKERGYVAGWLDKIYHYVKSPKINVGEEVDKDLYKTDIDNMSTSSYYTAKDDVTPVETNAKIHGFKHTVPFKSVYTHTHHPMQAESHQGGANPFVGKKSLYPSVHDTPIEEALKGLKYKKTFVSTGEDPYDEKWGMRALDDILFYIKTRKKAGDKDDEIIAAIGDEYGPNIDFLRAYTQERFNLNNGFQNEKLTVPTVTELFPEKIVEKAIHSNGFGARKRKHDTVFVFGQQRLKKVKPTINRTTVTGGGFLTKNGKPKGVTRLTSRAKKAVPGSLMDLAYKALPKRKSGRGK